MKNKKIAWILLITMLFWTGLSGGAMADVIEEGAPGVNAGSYIVVDGDTGEVLFGNNYQQQQAPASITKIMTAILALESSKIDEEVSVPELPQFLGESDAVTIHLAKGEKYPLKNLVEVMLVASANDAAYVIANGVSGSVDKFVIQMNSKAADLGMTNTTFKNPHGLDEDGHLTTAEDMAKLARYAMQNETFREMVMVQQVNWKGISYEKPLPTTNKLFSIMPEATGIKTGNTSAAQRTLVASAQRDSRELIGVILGAPDEGIFQSMKNILEFGFSHTKIVPVIQKDNVEMTLQYEDNKQVRIAAGEDYNMIQSTDNAAIVSYQRKLTNLELPIKKDAQVGVIEILADGTVIDEVPLVALDSVSKPFNWFFFGAVLLSVIYIASIISRIVNGIRKRRRKQRPARELQPTIVQQQRNQYEQLVNSVQHPKQTPKQMNKKTLTSSRDRNRPQR